MDEKEFIKICKDKKFWQWVNNKSIVPYKKIINKDSFLKELFIKIANRKYYPNPPKEYLTINKGHGVLRVVPVLDLKDLVVFYYCTRKLESYIAVNHTPGTYGGFGLSGKLRRVEEDEIKDIDDKLDVINFEGDDYVFQELNGYSIQSTFNPKGWQAEWGDFTDKLYHHVCDFQDSIGENIGIIAELDIANFYDSIQLDNLEYKIRKYISNKESEVVYLLIHFLRFWNRHINFYRQQGAGIPQDLFGECSRILANFYLQNFDKSFSEYCKKFDSQYFRYADDQIILVKDPSNLDNLISKASSLLMKEGLNFNQKKVKIMDVDEFKKYYSFDNFIHLSIDKKPNKKLIKSLLENQIEFYLVNSKNLRNRGISLLKRILNIIKKYDVYPSNFNEIKKIILNYNFFHTAKFNAIDWETIYNLLDSKEKNEMIKIFNKMIRSSYYSYFLYEAKKFYIKLHKSTNTISGRINYLKKFYSLT